MNKQHFMRNTLIVLLSALLLLCAAVLATSVFVDSSTAYAADAQLTEAPLAYQFTAAEGEEEAYYTVTGINTTSINLLSEDEKKSLKITIPAVYNDETNGEAPVKVIGEKAFSEITVGSNENKDNKDVDFVEIDLSKADNLETIGAGSFAGITFDKVLTLSKNVKTILSRAFEASNLSGIVFNDALEYVASDAFGNSLKLSGTVNITPKLQFGDLKNKAGNAFFGTKVERFTVDAKNQHYKAEDGVLFSKDGTILFAYPGGKLANVYRAPTTVTEFAYRSFYTVSSIKTVVLPENVVEMGAYAFSNCTANVYLNSNPTTHRWSPISFQSLKGKIICDTAAVKDNLSGKFVSANLLSFNDISMTFDVGADTIYTTSTLEQLKQYVKVVGIAEGDITIPLDNFTLSLPEDGFVVGANQITVEYGDKSSVFDIEMSKGTPTAPESPIVIGQPTTNSITLTEIAGAEYSCDNGLTWQSSPIFTELEANTEYTFLARIKATETAFESPASEVLRVKTAQIPTDNDGLSGGAIAGIVIAVILVVGILALLALFLFRKDKSRGFKEFYVELGRKCAATVKGWCGKIKALLSKENAEKSIDKLPEESEADEVSATESEEVSATESAEVSTTEADEVSAIETEEVSAVEQDNEDAKN